MTLINSISGIRGTLGGKEKEGLTPLDIVKYTSAFVSILSKDLATGNKNKRFFIGRDGRASGVWICDIVRSCIMAAGFDVIDLGLTTTPTIGIAVKAGKACGGIIVTASHNPSEWNALKLLDHRGTFISEEIGHAITEKINANDFVFASFRDIGESFESKYHLDDHINKIVKLKAIDIEAIKQKNLKVVVDPINSSGSTHIPPLLEALGVTTINVIHGNTDIDFEHNPEPLPKNLTDLSERVVELGYDMGISVDPDCDRLCFVCEDGSFFGEEYTLAVVVDHILDSQKGAVVSNLSSSRVVRDIAEKHGCDYFPSKVGETNVVKKMKEIKAVIGGEGNGGVIYPKTHYGRDALVGIGLFLSKFAQTNSTLSHFRKQYPNYYLLKDKIKISGNLNWEVLIDRIKTENKENEVNTSDGIKIDFAKSWVHLRKSNTEPIIRIYSEANTKEEAEELNMYIKNIVRACRSQR